MGDEIADARSLTDDDRLLELKIEDDVENDSDEWLIELVARLLPCRDPVCRAQEIYESQELRQREGIAKRAATGGCLPQQTTRHPGLAALLRCPDQLADLRLSESSGIVRARWHIAHMVDQRFAGCNVPVGSLLAAYLEGQEEMELLYDGNRLRAAALGVLSQLPDGPLRLLTTSAAGAGLVAACAAMRDQPTQWRHINLVTGALAADGLRTIIVEPLDAGPGWQASLKERFPDASLVTPQTRTSLALAA